MTGHRIRKPVEIVFLLMSLILVIVSLVGMPEIVRAAGEVVSASECTSPEITQSELVAIVSTTPPSPLPETEATADGTQVDDEAVTQAVTNVIRLSVACANANAPFRSLSLFSDNYIQRRFGPEPQDDIGHLIASMSRTPGPVEEKDLLSLDSIDDATFLTDGRVSVRVTTSNADAVFVDAVILINVDGDWLIDEVVLGDGGGTPTPAS